MEELNEKKLNDKKNKICKTCFFIFWIAMFLVNAVKLQLVLFEGSLPVKDYFYNFGLDILMLSAFLYCYSFYNAKKGKLIFISDNQCSFLKCFIMSLIITLLMAMITLIVFSPVAFYYMYLLLKYLWYLKLLYIMN